MIHAQLVNFLVNWAVNVASIFAQMTQKLGQIHFVVKFTQVSNTGSSWPSCFLFPAIFQKQSYMRSLRLWTVL